MLRIRHTWWCWLWVSLLNPPIHNVPSVPSLLSPISDIFVSSWPVYECLQPARALGHHQRAEHGTPQRRYQRPRPSMPCADGRKRWPVVFTAYGGPILVATVSALGSHPVSFPSSSSPVLFMLSCSLAPP